ncbi:hypothetical protein K504DRAFT_500316 [Pleomassaria siparia CBS 279.74]|uniref:N-acetyltransferase domain-containing protein n=1 Tax=Pleomassaria siparia CBS 279.74 TaxID=1314801 RepID=A0A6G1KFV6_9PLEO|nr:hypothetical protein K504DRAFT_500316 [Pleomassaria siparia CBS 279.74]
MTTPILFQKLGEDEMTEDIIKQAADLFSTCYGVWGPRTEEKVGKFCKKGRRIKMSPSNLRRQILPDGGRNILVRALVGGEYVGHAFAARWVYGERRVCWITQLCVGTEYRRRGLAVQPL